MASSLPQLRFYVLGSSIYLERSKYEWHAPFESGDPDPRAVLETGHLFGTGDPRQLAGRRTRGVHHSADAGVSAGAEGRVTPGQEDRERSVIRAGDRPERVSQRPGAR